jgi:hypothetical protein
MKLLIELFCRNFWGWGHLLLSVFITTLVWRLIIVKNKSAIKSATKMESNKFLWKWRFIGLGIIIFVAVGWEVGEYWFESVRIGKTVLDTYGTLTRYWYDTIGDIIFGIIGYCIGVI